MREVLAGIGVIIILGLIIVGVGWWAHSGFEKNLDKGFKEKTADYTAFSVQGERFKVKDIKSVESIPMTYSQDFYKIYMNHLNFIWQLHQLMHLDCLLLECQ